MEAGRRWDEIEWFATEVGDGTVPERSAIHPEADRKLPFVVGHGDIYISPAVIEFLQWELVDKYQELDFAVLVTPDYSLLFEPDRDAYAPGETITVRAQAFGEAAEDGSRAPFAGARVVANLNWLEPLPGDPAPDHKPEPQSGSLSPEGDPGNYSTQINAPEVEGYYQLVGEVHLPGHHPIELAEIILVEAEAQGVS